MTSVLLLHSWEDTDYANAVRVALKGIPGIEPGEHPTTEEAATNKLRDQLQAVDAVVVLLSPYALRSTEVMFGIGAAQSLGKEIFPVWLQRDAGGEDLVGDEVKRLDASNMKPAETASRIMEMLHANDAEA